MKKFVIALLICILALSATAQQPDNRPNPAPAGYGQQPAAGGIVTFRARSNETFVVYVDGIPLNRVPQQQVSLSNSGGTLSHITIRLASPEDRVTSFDVAPTLRNLTYMVDYNARRGLLTAYQYQETGAYPGQQPNSPYPPQPVRPGQPATPAVPQPVPGHPAHPAHPTAPVPPAVTPQGPIPGRPLPHATENEMSSIMGMIKQEAFDNDKLSLAKTFIKSKSVTTAQVIRLAQSISFENKRLDLLLYAYEYCVDPANYYQTAEVLTYSSNKQKLLDAIQ